MTTQIKLRRDTAANWASVNPVLGVGEVGLETDTRKAKFGDGATAWNSLAGYLVAPDTNALTSSTTFAGDAAGLYNALVVDRMSQDINFPSDATITNTGTLTDYSLSSTVAVLRWNGASDLNFNGMQGGADGRMVFIVNVTTANYLTLDHDATSSAANRFYCEMGGSLLVRPLTGVIVLYDSTLSRWLVLAAHGLSDNQLADAKGDIFVALSGNSITRLAVGANDQVLTADSAQSTGVKWAAAPGGGGGSATYAGTWRYPGI